MNTLITFILLLFFISHHKASTALTCKKTTCPALKGSTIRFPFRLNGSQPERCGYPGFDLSCNNESQAVIYLKFGGEFIVNSIDYWTSTLAIKDPKGCMPKLWLNSPNLEHMFDPFQVVQDFYAPTYTFLNCTPNITNSISSSNIFSPISCLSSDNYTVAALLTNDYYNYATSLPCNVLSKNVRVPIQTTYGESSSDLYGDVLLRWAVPDCEECEGEGGICKFKSNFAGLEIGCSKPSRIFEYCLTAGIVVCTFTCLVWLVSHVFMKDRADREHWKRLIVESCPSNYDNSCSICLCEYQSGEMLRTITNCKHCFHGYCIEKWLLKNATCPLCRNLADGYYCSYVLSVS